MINGTIKLKVLQRREFPDGQRQNVCAVLVGEEKDYVFGKTVTHRVECWIPTFMERRLPFIMDEKNVYLIFTFDHVMTPSENEYTSGRAHYGVKVTAAYHG